jgi:hypothetical protein
MTTNTPDHDDTQRLEPTDPTDPTREVDLRDDQSAEPLDTQLLGPREHQPSATHVEGDTTWAPAPIPVQHNASGTVGSHPTDDATSHATRDADGTAQASAPVPERPSGPHLPPVLLGLVCLAVAGLVLWQELGEVSVDWGNVGPLGIVAVGGLLVVLGLFGLVGTRRRSTS